MSENGKKSDSNSGGKLETGIRLGKEISALLKELILLVLFLLLLVWPESFNSLLTRAGFEEGSVVGFKWKKQLDATNNDLSGAKQVIEDLTSRLNAANEAMKKAYTETSDAALKKELEALLDKNKEASQAASATGASIANTLQSNALLVTLAQQSLYSGSTSWGIVFGGDSTLDAAQYEISRAKKAGFANTTLFLRQGYYRSVVLFESREAAVARLGDIQKLRAGAYIVNMEKWCPVKPNMNEAYQTCNGS